MARALLVALAWCAVRSEEYGGGAMPQYGGADYERGALADDYRGHSPDAPAPLDYKYEEEPPDDTEKSAKYVEDADRWRRLEKLKRRPPRDDNKQDDNDVDADSGLSSKVSKVRHRTRRRARGRRDEPRQRADRQPRAGRDEGQLARYLDDIDYRDDRSRNVDDDERILSRETTARFIRRKPRDRKYAPQPGIVKSSEEIVNQELISNKGFKSDKSDESDYWTGDDSARPPARMRPMLPDSDTDVESTTKQRGRPRPITYQDYSEYYDSKVKDIQNKLPEMFRRTTTERRAESAAERELHALLGAHRRRKEAPSTEPGAPPTALALTLPPSAFPPTSLPPSTLPPPTLPPAAVDPALAAQWRAFIAGAGAVNCAVSPHFAFSAFLVVINSFIRL